MLEYESHLVRPPVELVAPVQVYPRASELMDMMIQLMTCMDKLEKNTSKRLREVVAQRSADHTALGQRVVV